MKVKLISVSTSLCLGNVIDGVIAKTVKAFKCDDEGLYQFWHYSPQTEQFDTLWDRCLTIDDNSASKNDVVAIDPFGNICGKWQYEEESGLVRDKNSQLCLAVSDENLNVNAIECNVNDLKQHFNRMIVVRFYLVRLPCTQMTIFYIF